MTNPLFLSKDGRIIHERDKVLIAGDYSCGRISLPRRYVGRVGTVKATANEFSSVEFYEPGYSLGCGLVCNCDLIVLEDV